MSRIIVTPRLRLRPFTPADLAFVFRGLSHPDVVRHYGVSYATLQSTQEQMDFYRALEREQTGQWWLVEDRFSGEPLGAAGVNGIHPSYRRCEMGYWLLKEWWGSGYMFEALPYVCRYAFEQLNVHRIEALIEVDNDPSIRLIERLGFTREGTMRECEWKNDRWLSLHVYAMLEHE